MDPREYQWQMGDLAYLDPNFGPDERRMQPPAPEKAWAVPTQGMAPWPYMEQPAQGDAGLAQQAREAAAYRLRNPYQTAATRPQESNRLTAIASAIGSMPGAMGELAAIPGHTMADNPYSPGSEEADFYERARKSNTYAKAPEAAFNLMGVGATFPATGGLGMLGGRMALTADLDKMRKAEEMLQYNKAPEQVRTETGWFPTAGGILKFHISDKGAGWIEDPSKLSKARLPASASTGEAFAHPRGYEAYPELSQWPVTIRDLGPGGRGGFRPRIYEQDMPHVFIAPGSRTQMQKTMGHELFTHGVQELEPTFPRGGNPDVIYQTMKEGTPAWDEYLRMRQQLLSPMSREEYEAMLADAGATGGNYENYVAQHNKVKFKPEIEELMKKDAAFKTYKKLAAEEDARATEKMMGLSDKRIRETPIENFYDTPFAQQIIEPRVPLKPGKKPPAVDFGMNLSMGDLADQGLILSQQQPKGFTPGSILGTGTGIQKASPEEIARAAAESRKGMTQPELRNLYDELGLTKTGATDIAQPSLAQSQPKRAIKEATELKFLDREMLDTLTKKQREIYQDKGKLPEGMVLPSQEAAGEATAEFKDLKKQVTKAEAAFDAEKERGFRPMSIFDLRPETLRQTPDVPQYPLPRVEPKRTERMIPAGQGGLGRIERAASRAPEENWGWYNLMQTRNIMHAIHGPERGEQVFRNWVDGIAGTSMLNPIDNNIRSSTWYLQQILQGKPLPEVLNLTDPVTGKTVQTIAGGPPAGYGAKSQVQHAARVRDFITNDFDPVANAKPISYRENLLGNWMPRTVDTHDIRNLVGMPRGLAFKNKPLLPGEYTYLEDIGGRAAARAGTAQGPQQAATWIGGGEYTGLKSYPAPFLGALDRRAQVTAQVRGITPMQALIESFTPGGRPLLGIGGAAVGAAAVRGSMGDLAAQDEYRYQ